MSYRLIETIEVGSGGAASIEFTNIPQNGKDLLLVMSLQTETATFQVRDVSLLPNASTANGASKRLFSETSVISDTKTAINIGIMPAINGTARGAAFFGNTNIYISNYASNGYKAIYADYSENSTDTRSWSGFSGASWNNTTPISSLKFRVDLGEDFSQYSTASLCIIS